MLVDDSTGSLAISAIIDWGNAGVDPLEADYEVVLMELLLPVPDDRGYVTPDEPDHFREMCDAFGAGYRGKRGIEIDWPVIARSEAVLSEVEGSCYEWPKSYRGN